MIGIEIILRMNRLKFFVPDSNFWTSINSYSWLMRTIRGHLLFKIKQNKWNKKKELSRDPLKQNTYHECDEVNGLSLFYETAFWFKGVCSAFGVFCSLLDITRILPDKCNENVHNEYYVNYFFFEYHFQVFKQKKISSLFLFLRHWPILTLQTEQNHSQNIIHISIQGIS